MTLNLPTTATQNPQPYRLFYDGTNKTLTAWISLPYPFDNYPPYPSEDEAYTISCTATVTGNGSSLSGLIEDAVTMKPLPGATALVGGRALTSDANGSFYVPLLPPGSLMIQISDPGYTPYQATKILPPFSAVRQTFNLAPSNSTLSVTSLTDGYQGFQYFLDGVSFPVTFTANINWGGHPPGVVRFMTPRKTIDVSDANGEASQAFDMGGDFGAGGQLQVMAISADGTQSLSVVAPFVVMPAILPFFFNRVAGNEIGYTTVSVGPNWDVIDELVDSGLIPSSIPIFGGQSVNLHVFPTVEGTIENNILTLAASFDGADRFKWADLDVTISPRIGAIATFVNNQWNWGGTVGVNADLNESHTWPFFIEPIPLPFYSKVEFSLSANLSLGVVAFSPPTFNGDLKFPAAVQGSFGLGIDTILAVAGWLKGEGTVELQYPQTPTLKSYSIDVTAGITAYAFLFKLNRQFFEWTYPSANPSALVDRNFLRSQASVPFGRDYVATAGYGRFEGRPTRRPPTNHSGGATNAANPAFYSLQNQVFPFSESDNLCQWHELFGRLAL